MLPVVGFSMAVSSTPVFSGAGIDAMDLLVEEVAGQSQLACLPESLLPGIVNVDLGQLSLADDVATWCEKRRSEREWIAVHWGTSVSVTLVGNSSGAGERSARETAAKAVLEIQRFFAGSQVFVDFVAAIKEPPTVQQDAEFLAQLLAATGSGWLVNAAEIYTDSQNRGFDPYDRIAEVAPSASTLLVRIAAARFDKRSRSLTTCRSGLIPDAVWSLARHALVLGGHKTRAVMITRTEERDGGKQRESDARHARFLIDRVQGRQRLLRKQNGFMEPRTTAIERRS